VEVVKFFCQDFYGFYTGIVYKQNGMYLMRFVYHCILEVPFHLELRL